MKMSAALSLPQARQATPVVLVVDDEPSICMALTIALRRARYEAIAAGSGDEAEGHLRARRIDGLVLDLRMPDVRGDVLFYSAVALQPHLARATVFVTGDVTEKAAQLVEACACPLVQKPFDLAHVLAAVEKVVQKRRSESA